MITIPCIYRASLLLRVFSLGMLPSFGGYRLKEKVTVTLGHSEVSSGLLEVLPPEKWQGQDFPSSVSTAAGMSCWLLPQDLRVRSVPACPGFEGGRFTGDL